MKKTEFRQLANVLFSYYQTKVFLRDFYFLSYRLKPQGKNNPQEQQNSELIQSKDDE